MQITNEYGLPQQMVELCSQDYIYEPGEYRVTSLLKGIKETLLLRRHSDEIVVDVSEMVWLLFGSAVHHILEKQNLADSELGEERLKVRFGDYILSGQFDLYCAETNMITDYKTASVWKIVFGDYKDWKQQQLIYAYMLRDAGFDVDRGRVWAFLKDHRKSEARKSSDYPRRPVAKVDFDLSGDAGEWIKNKFEEIRVCELLEDDAIPTCTEEERWYTGTTYAVMKKGRKSALRVLKSMEDAELWMEANGKGEYIEERAGMDNKCVEYCWAAPFCNYWRETYGDQ